MPKGKSPEKKIQLVSTIIEKFVDQIPNEETGLYEIKETGGFKFTFEFRQTTSRPPADIKTNHEEALKQLASFMGFNVIRRKKNGKD